MTKPTIGNFRSPPDNTLRKEATVSKRGNVLETRLPPEEKAPAAPPPAAPAASEAAPTPLEEKRLTPAEEYRERLTQAGIDYHEAERIYDAVLTKGYYEEYVRVRDSRAVLRTRSYEDHLRLQTALELEKPQLVISQEEMITRYNLAASLVEWKGESLPHNGEADFKNVMTLIRKMPGPLYSLLARELAKFDAKVMLVFSDGATENF